MPVSPARKVAYQILRRVESGRSFAVDLLQRQEVSELQEVDRRLATELTMGILRWRGELDYQSERLSGKPLKYFDPEVATILRLGIYQIRFLEKIPKAAVVNEAVEMTKAARKRSAAGLVNAVLRKCEPAERAKLAVRFEEAEPETKESACRTLPNWLFERWSQHFGPQVAQALAWASISVPPTTLRITTPERDREEIQRRLEEEGIKTRPGLYSNRALLVESGNAQSSRAWGEGQVVIQDEASQLVADLVAPAVGQRVLDFCAAPGIKTQQLSAALGNGMLVACDLSPRRLRTMAKFLSKGLPADLRLHRVRLDATRSLPFGVKFDRILLDVPCSGTGTLARNPEIKLRLRQNDLLRLAEVQGKMLRNALEVLAPLGRLVYATCSLEPEENELVVEKVLLRTPGCRLLDRIGLSSEFPHLSSLFDPHGYFRTRPDLHSMDGFFAALVVRHTDEANASLAKSQPAGVGK